MATSNSATHSSASFLEDSFVPPAAKPKMPTTLWGRCDHKVSLLCKHSETLSAKRSAK